jgi:hypothetical protein
MVKFMQQGTTVMSDVHCETLKELCRAIQKKRCRMLTYGVVLLHENPCLHAAAGALSLLEHFIWELFDHPAYFHDLTPSDYRLFTHMYQKNRLGSQHFNSNE